MNIPYFIRVKDDNEKKNRKMCVTPSITLTVHYVHDCLCPSVDLRDLLLFREYKEYSSRLVSDFIDRVSESIERQHSLLQLCVCVCVCVCV